MRHTAHAEGGAMKKKTEKEIQQKVLAATHAVQLQVFVLLFFFGCFFFWRICVVVYHLYVWVWVLAWLWVFVGV